MNNLQGKHVHIIGIGGTGMSAIALVLEEMGVTVTGSDRTSSNAVMFLEKCGIPVFIGQHAENVQNADLVVYSSAITKDNPELVEANQRGIITQKRMEFLESILSDREVVAISGTHGKTTTTSMTAWLLKSLGTEPGFIIGSTPKDLGKNAEAGKGNLFVIEADEYDRMFLGLHPAVAVVTKVEHDHPDCYPTEESYLNVFSEFLANTRKNGIILLNADDPKQSKITHSLDTSIKVFRFGIQESADFVAENLQIRDKGCYGFDFIDNPKNKKAHVQLSIAGKQNVYNALTALSICALRNLDIQKTAVFMSRFQGIERRFETVAEWNGITIIDDYAHHPTEIRMTLETACSAFPGRRIWAMWQPHTFSRTKTLLDDFCGSFSDADVLLVTNIYASREKQQDFSFEDLKTTLREKHPDTFFAETNEIAVDILKKNLKTGDVVVTLSAGDANQIGPKALSELKKEVNSVFYSKYGKKIQFDVPLSRFSQALCGGPAKELLIAETTEELIEIVRFYRNNQNRYQVFGGLTNILFSDNGFDGSVIFNRTNSIRIDKTPEGAHITAASGTPLISVVKACAEAGLEGYEWAYGIPGTLGGAIYGNAGAFGSETAKIIFSVKLLKDDQETIELSNAEMGFAYRSSVLKRKERKGTILSAVLVLKNGDPIAIKEKMEQILARRRVIHSERMGSLGSVFRNPGGEYAGKLISDCGLRGKTIGKARISENHGNTILTEPGAKSSDFLALVHLAQEEVKKQFGIDLIPEIEIST